MPTWVFLRGLSRESRHWGGFIEQFQLGVPGARVVTIDLPGNGLLNAQRSPCNVPDVVTHCRAQLVTQGVLPPYNILAMSLGAMVSTAWSHAHPQEVDGQVLINTSLRPFSPFYHRLQPHNYASLVRLVLIGGNPEEWEGLVLRLTSNGDHEQVIPHWLRIRRDNPVSTANALRQLFAAIRYRAPVNKPAVPTLVLASELDHLVSNNCSKALTHAWQCTLRIHPWAGHDLPLDDGAWVIEQVKGWRED
jgi:pimeloyl-ACP methyl ester carboxylesterase